MYNDITIMTNIIIPGYTMVVHNRSKEINVSLEKALVAKTYDQEKGELAIPFHLSSDIYEIATLAWTKLQALTAKTRSVPSSPAELDDMAWHGNSS